MHAVFHTQSSGVIMFKVDSLDASYIEREWKMTSPRDLPKYEAVYVEL